MPVKFSKHTTAAEDYQTIVIKCEFDFRLNIFKMAAILETILNNSTL